MTILRILLLPFSVLYGIIVSFRNLMYDFGFFKSTSFDIPIITVGNLSVGGTGKTPQIEYLIRLLQDKTNIAVLSRGYKRKSKGFVLANENTTVEELGDEPFQFYQKFSKINVAVNGDRVAGVKQLLKLQAKTNLILLDDAYQHRRIKAGYQILLSAYADLFYKDFMMPTGNLRELWWGKNRADVIVVTKCPKDLSVEEQLKITAKINPSNKQKVFFTTIAYAPVLKGSKKIALEDLQHKKVILITGIAKPEPLLTYLKSKEITFEHLAFPDHHHFTIDEIKTIQQKGKEATILTTEKDYVRLEKEIEELYYLPIETVFINNQKLFNEQVEQYVNKKAS
ncbi:tetraacyldisaccharide 4'-kinase [Wenyingzhuangia fucanilytica]|uniref:Tetraacyldisaccharide 4'-kinase n=1 Tax=Wenyingzhuangia fucanilytica TaxID=1790137 RepID=A0A1B1Y9M5_9FLAO|nr:tetraacyldisaccharide 4'-kinase [Wenyingzhuangia fucanilytica]ANW97483.1 tetraacyldisaccharide 4'-kinase [Wenyingzhuangia fucanilytica]